MIEVAVIGSGHWGPNLIRNFSSNRSTRVAWIVDKDPSRLQEAGVRFPEARRTESVTDVLEDSTVQAVVVATPTITHYPLVKAALKAQKHVFVEKPIARSSDEGEDLARLAADAGRVLMVGHVFLYNAGVRRVRQLLDEGELGRVYYMSMVRTNLGPVRTDVDAAWDLAAQDISIANYWLRATPSIVSAVGGSWINEGINDTVFATLRYPDQVLVHLHVSWLNPRKARDITVVGERRMLTLDDMNLAEPLRIYDKRVTETRSKLPWIDSFATFRSGLREGDIIIPKISPGEPLKEECDHFVHCIETGERPLTDAAQGIGVVRVLEALERSAQNAGRETAIA